MKIDIDVNKLIRNGLTPDQFILLTLCYYNQHDRIKKLFGIKRALSLRDDLVDTKYILSKKKTRFKDTIVSKANVSKLIGVRSDKINFWEFYNSYPMKHGSRIFRAANPDSQLAMKHEKKYLMRVKTKKHHDKVVKATQAFVNKQRINNKLQYLPAMETVLNNSLWEQWEEFIETAGKEGANWNTTTI